ncbi:MAG: ABC transporter substrate-binding protein [Bacteroidales bacterium]
MKRRLFSIFVASVAVVASLAMWTTRPSPRKVVVMGHAPVTDAAFAGLRRGLAASGWREDDSISFVHPAPVPTADGLRAQAQHFIDRNTALVVALSTPAALAAREVASPLGVPILLAPSSDPVSAGLVSSVSHPDQPVTGIAVTLQEARRLEMLARLAPASKRIWVPYDGADPGPTAIVNRLQATAAKLQLTLIPADIRSAAELHRALDPLPRDIDAIFLPHDALLASHTRAIITAAASRGVPVTVAHREGVALGALFSYGFDLHSLGQQAARLADQVLSGTPATDLPIESAELDMTVNLAVADHLGLAIPDDVLRHAAVVGLVGE